ncbi:hypothetical protein GCM10022389_21530 [Flavobacterium cheonanense]|uniref:Transmembrane protein n=1 Tax=Flavobacterium cheonanense TaxID=706183 RepID=A0ABP7VWG7_9FLAO
MNEKEEKEECEINYKLVYHAERQKRVWESYFYSHQRIDILIIALSSAGIYICLETMKYLYEHNACCINPIIKISAFFLVLTILLNLISQWYSTKIHYNDYDICEYCISLSEEDIMECKDEIKKREKVIEENNKKSTNATKASFAFLFLGVSLLLIFFFFIF